MTSRDQCGDAREVGGHFIQISLGDFSLYFFPVWFRRAIPSASLGFLLFFCSFFLAFGFAVNSAQEFSIWSIVRVYKRKLMQSH